MNKINKVLMSAAAILVLAGCGENHSHEKQTLSPSTSPDASSVSTAEASPSASAKTQKPASSSVPSASAAAQITADPASLAGTYYISSYEDSDGNVQTFDPGRDNSIIGSSSVILNSDGSCQFNLPGMNGDDCSWNGTSISASGAVIVFTADEKALTVTSGEEVYTFEKAQ